MCGEYKHAPVMREYGEEGASREIPPATKKQDPQPGESARPP